MAKRRQVSLSALKNCTAATLATINIKNNLEKKSDDCKIGTPKNSLLILGDFVGICVTLSDINRVFLMGSVVFSILN